jgi:hypothetical protein
MMPMSMLRFGLASVLLAITAGAAQAQPTLPPLADPKPPPADAPITHAPPLAQAPPPSDIPPAAPPPSAAPDAAAPDAVTTVAAPIPVQAQALKAPDLFSAEGAATGLPPDLWKGASADLARQVLPLVARKTLTPVAAAFGRKLMSTAATAPEGAGDDVDLAAARIGAVLNLGDAAGARAMIEHTPGVRQNAALAHVAAEADLVLGREDEACGIGDGLAVGKDEPYFRRLRAYCLLRAGDGPGAQLAYDLAAEQAKDDTYKRLMSAAVSGVPAGDASLRNGLEYALSKRLQLDLAPAIPTAWAPIPPVLAKDAAAPLPSQSAAAARVAQPLNDVSKASALDSAARDAALALADGKTDARMADDLAGAGQGGSVEAQGALALYIAAGAPAGAKARGAFAGFDIGKSAANQARLLELDAPGASKGDMLLLVLGLAADAGEAGPAVADRARMVRAMRRAGFEADARAYALEGMLGLQPPPPPPPPAPAAKKPAKTVPPPRRRPRA